MKNRKFGVTILLAALWCLGFPAAGKTQDLWHRWYGALTYEISWPTGDTNDIISETSFRGIGLDARNRVNENTTAGLFFGWNVFYERTTETTQLETDPPGAVTGTQDRTLNVFPIMASVHRYLTQRGGKATPFFGVNAGGYIMLQRLAIGVVAIDNDRWDWGIAPEAGLIFHLQRGANLLVSGKYNYAFTGESVGGADINHQWWSLNMGFAWRE